MQHACLGSGHAGVSATRHAMQSWFRCRALADSGVFFSLCQLCHRPQVRLLRWRQLRLRHHQRQAGKLVRRWLQRRGRRNVSRRSPLVPLFMPFQADVVSHLCSYAMRRDSSAITIWFWPSGSEPEDVSSSAQVIDESTWGTPTATFPSSDQCTLDDHFDAHQIVLNLTFCGDWAGELSFRSNGRKRGGTRRLAQSNLYILLHGGRLRLRLRQQLPFFVRGSR